MKKEIIFVRHAECETNETDVHQAGNQVETDRLTEAGLTQARAMAQRFGRIAVEKIVSSSYLRARQTARFIAEETETPVMIPVYTDDGIRELDEHDPHLSESTALLRELDVPSELAGRPFHSHEAVEIKRQAEPYLREPHERFSDQENLYDQWQRSADIAAYLIDQPEKVIVVVSHGGLIKYLLGHLALAGEEDMPLEHKVVAADRMARFMWYNNTGVTAVTYDDSAQKWQWLPADIEHLHPKYFNILPDKKELAEEDTTAEI